MKKLILMPILILVSSCSKLSSGAGSATSSPTVSSEIAECTTTTAYSSPVIISGTATFYKRGLNVSTSGGGTTVSGLTLGAAISTALPIKFAEISVLNSAGSIIQCGITDSSGNLKAVDGTSNLNIPNTAGNYTVNVLSRSNHTLSVPNGKTAFKFYTSVKADIYSNSVYTLAKTVASAGSGTVTANLIAYARESESTEVNGGAFNIYNDILISYEYLAQSTAIASNLTCLNPKLDVFWKVGFNPAQYVYPNEDPSSLGTLSFYVRGDNQLYINGGQLGNITSSDTDHFDDTVIIHELGHHVEDVCGKMDSPGGTHYGLYRIDPRLAWSEGWGNFFGAHQVRNSLSSINPDLAGQLPASGWLHYLDTKGYTEGSVTTGGEYIRLNFSKAGNNPETASGGTRYYDKVDAATNPGEGLFREVSISRSLFKSTNVCSTCTGVDNFSYIWKAFENSGVGMGQSIYPFRSAARFYSRLNQAFAGATPAAIDAILNSDEAQQRETNAAYTVGGYRIDVPYGIKLVPSGVSCNLKIQPRSNSGLDANYLSDQRFSNHFYTIDLASLPGVTEIWLTSAYVAGTTGIDVDPILYKEGYTYDQDCAVFSGAGICTSPQKSISADMLRYDRSAGNGTKKILTLTALSAANSYLLNVRAYIAGTTSISTATEYTYTLKDQTGGYLCPAASY
ncbi:MAG: hypothetical protein WA160_16355 [Pseudobdellovibrio sp.]